MKSYKLFLDDIRNPTDCTNYSTMFMPSNRNSFYEGDWIIVRTYNEFVYTIKELYSNGGSLDVISFDHDLADFQDNVEYTGVDCAKWLVDFLIANAYEVLTISKDKSNSKGVIDMSGESDLIKVAGLIKHAEFHMGVSSGLSWLAWAVDTHVVMVSDSTPKFHEFESDITRISANNLQSIDYGDVEVTKVDEVLNKIKLLLFS